MRVYEGLQLDVDMEQVEVNGKTMTRETVRRPNAVVMVGGPSPGTFVLVRQYRHAAGMKLTELPAGKVDPDEDLAKAAIREFHEETGLLFENVEYLGMFYPSPGYSDERIHAFSMVGIPTGMLKKEADDEIDSVLVFNNHNIDMVIRNLHDAKTKLALAMYRDHYFQQGD